jgi:sterol desaturase/sphingolipid hydroxylase (fatty acid hydroxylase superfamily)
MSVNVIVAVAAGVLTWTLLEYIIHRWMGHHRRFKRTPFAVEHIRHHIEGNYFAPTWKKAIFGTLVAVVLSVPAILIAGAVGITYVTALMTFYFMYELLHRREHTHAGIGPYGRWVRRHHFHHHFVDGRVNHGVTTPLWDHVFRTYQRPTVIPVPRKLVMEWLLDPATGDVRAAHAETYRLR